MTFRSKTAVRIASLSKTHARAYRAAGTLVVFFVASVSQCVMAVGAEFQSPGLHSSQNQTWDANRSEGGIDAGIMPVRIAQDTQTSTEAASTTAATTPSPKKSGKSDSLPKRIAGIITGTVVGTPVCAVRCSVWEEKYATKGMVGDTDDKFLQVAAGTFWLPLGLMTGVCEAPFSALKRSYVNSDKPFSKDQFSLGHIDWK